MKRKQLGNSDLVITPAGLGSWAMGGASWQFAWGKQDDDDSEIATRLSTDTCRRTDLASARRPTLPNLWRAFGPSTLFAFAEDAFDPTVGNEPDQRHANVNRVAHPRMPK
jgi:hypothetical protein